MQSTNEGSVPYINVPDSTPLLQGDIIVWHKPRSKFRNSYSIVINADCDLDQDNIPGFLTCIPVVAVETYLNGIWLKGKLREERDKAVRTISDVLNSALRNADKTHQSITKSMLEEIINSDNPEKYFGAMKFKADAQRAGVIKEMKYLKGLTKIFTQKVSNQTRRKKFVTLTSKKNQ